MQQKECIMKQKWNENAIAYILSSKAVLAVFLQFSRPRVREHMALRGATADIPYKYNITQKTKTNPGLFCFQSLNYPIKPATPTPPLLSPIASTFADKSICK